MPTTKCTTHAIASQAHSGCPAATYCRPDMKVTENGAVIAHDHPETGFVSPSRAKKPDAFIGRARSTGRRRS